MPSQVIGLIELGNNNHAEWSLLHPGRRPARCLGTAPRWVTTDCVEIDDRQLSLELQREFEALLGRIGRQTG